MNIKQANENWSKLGENDPMWVVLTADDKSGGRWTPEEFFATGRKEIGDLLQTIRAAGVTVHFGTALDFGCGLGRLSQGLAGHFQRVDGIDISTSMIRQAGQYNQFPDKVGYHLNVKTDLSLFPRGHFDFVCSIISLQHVPSEYQLLYIGEFMDLLKGGGVAYFQTVHCLGWRTLVPNWFFEGYRSLKFRGKPYIPMYRVPPSAIEEIIRARGCRLQRKESVPNQEREKHFSVDRYLVVKPQVSG